MLLPRLRERMLLLLPYAYCRMPTAVCLLPYAYCLSLTVGMHLCRGNNQGKWLGEGGYEYVAEKLFHAVNIDVFFMEYDSPRAGSFAPLRHIPTDKHVVLGLISTKSGQMEDADALKQRIEEASRYFPLAPLSISPQCGFASTAPGNPLSPDEQRQKLKLVVQVAEEVW